MLITVRKNLLKSQMEVCLHLFSYNKICTDKNLEKIMTCCRSGLSEDGYSPCYLSNSSPTVFELYQPELSLYVHFRVRNDHHD
jgi:hypothetical protein